jgi:hypothetical protein
MAKRNRGSHRPGQRRSDRHAPSRNQPRPLAQPVQGLTADEEARAAALESEIVAQERSSQLARSRDQVRPEPETADKPRASSPLAVRAAAEYGYVSRDVRRIIRVGGSMIGLLGIVFVLVRVLNVISV